MLKKGHGFTLIETLIAGAFVVFMLLGAINLISTIYRNILATQLKTVSFNIASENIETLRSYSFGSLLVTPDSLLPAEPLSVLETSENPWGNPADPENIETYFGTQMKIYKIVQWAEETETGNITPKKQSELRNDSEKNLKMLKVIVTYPFKVGSNIDTRRTELISYISNSEASFGGCVIRGRVQKRDKTNGRVDPPGFSARVWVYVEGHPEYTTPVDTSNTDGSYRGYYTIYNVLPGKYNLFAQGDGYDRGEYPGNPLEVKIDDTEINGVNIVTPMSNNYTISGRIFDPDGNPVNPVNYSKIVIRANDGMSSTVTVNSQGYYTITNVDSNGRTIAVTAIFSQQTSGQTFYGQYINIPPTGGNNYNITLALAQNTGIVTVFTKDARDRVSRISAMNVMLVDTATNTVPAGGYGVTDGGGSCTFFNIPPGNYKISGAKAFWMPEKGDPFKIVSISPFTPDVNLYFFPTGNISGNIIEEITNQPPQKSIGVVAFSSGQKIAETYTNTENGYYLLENVYVGRNNRVRIYIDGSAYEYSNPENGTIDNVLVSHMSTTSNQNFSIKIGFKKITGSLNLNMGQGNSLIKDGVLIIAQPVSNTIPPHSYSLDSNSYPSQNLIKRRQYPAYGIISKTTGNYEISVPMGSNYDIYAYYSYISYTSYTDTTGTLIKCYKLISGAAPDTVQNFFGTWTNY